MISFDNFFDINPKVQYYPEFDPKGERNGVSFQGIKAITYEGAEYKGLRTKVYAHIGYPHKAEGKVPAVVLIHGGGGHPEDLWIKKWNEKGYAAIAMDTTGYFPTFPIPHLYEGYSEGLERRLVPPFYEDGFTVSPDNSGLTDSDAPIGQQWMYHAVAMIILAHNILRNDPKIDNEKIGISGISWGGVITSIAIGYDTRFRFAIPIYGSGYLREGLSDLNELFRTEDAEKWLAEKNFNKVKIPVMWLCWNDDCCFSVNSNSLSYLATMNNNESTCLSMLHNMRHSHVEGFTPSESYLFADMAINNVRPPRISAEYIDNKVYYSCDEKVKSVRLFTIDEKMSYVRREKYGSTASYMKQDWNIIELDPGCSCALLPEKAMGKYVEFTLQSGMVLTTPYRE